MARGPFKMKNPALHSGARKGTPIQANYESPLKAKGGQKPSKAMHADNPSTPVDTSEKDYTRGGLLTISGSKKAGRKSIGSRIKTGVDKIASEIGLKKRTGSIGDKMKQKYSGAAQRAGKVAKPGESQHQFKTRTRKSTPKVKKISDVPGAFSTKIKLGGGVVPNQKIMSTKVTKSKTKTKTKGPDWTKAPKVGTQKRRDWYTKNKLKQDDTTKIGKTAKIKEKRTEYVTR